MKEKRRKSLLHAREEASKRDDFRFLYTSSNTNPSTQLFISPSVRKEVAHNKKITLEISQKTWDFFQKNSHVFFVFLLRFSNSLGEKQKKIDTFSNGKKQGLMSFHQDSYLGYSIFRRKTRFFRKISTSICANQQNSIPLRYSIEKHRTYSPRKKRRFVQSSVLGLAKTPDFFALYYDNNGFCHKK